MDRGGGLWTGVEGCGQGWRVVDRGGVLRTGEQDSRQVRSVMDR